MDFKELFPSWYLAIYLIPLDVINETYNPPCVSYPIFSQLLHALDKWQPYFWLNSEVPKATLVAHRKLFSWGGHNWHFKCLHSWYPLSVQTLSSLSYGLLLWSFGDTCYIYNILVIPSVLWTQLCSFKSNFQFVLAQYVFLLLWTLVLWLSLYLQYSLVPY